MNLLPNIPRTRTPRWGRGVPVRADHLNQMVDPLNRMIEGVQPPRQVRRPIVRPTKGQFKIVFEGVFAQHVLARAWDADTEQEGSELIPILRPRLLQNPLEITYSRGGVTYGTWDPTDSQTRTATQFSHTDVHVVTPHYRQGDIIYATRGIIGGFDIVHPQTSGTHAVPDGIEWMDDNRDGRMWRIFEG